MRSLQVTSLLGDSLEDAGVDVLGFSLSPSEHAI